MAVKSSRDQARNLKPRIKEPEMIIPQSAHPALNKAAHYLGVKVVSTPLGEDYRADLEGSLQRVEESSPEACEELVAMYAMMAPFEKEQRGNVH